MLLRSLSVLALAAPLVGAVAGSAVHPETSSSDSNETPAPSAVAVAVHEEVRLDGVLTDGAWRRAPVVGAFTQRDPDEGEPATQPTEVRFIFDSDAIYIAARMYDDLGADGVTGQLLRRDAHPQSDWIEIVFDTFHDHVGVTSFAVNPSGVMRDAYGPGGHPDDSWDPVWEVSTQVDSLGWTAEMRIPFSQLRYPSDSVQTWGLQIWRVVHRLNEVSMWAFYPSSESGGPSRYGHLDGLRILRPPGKAEILPYVVSSNARLGSVDRSSPFYRSNDVDFRVGADLKYLLTSNLTVTAAINPDFGQVEVDPAVVNLSEFETFFSEKRPFFVEGRGFLGMSGLWCYFCSNISSISTFYSRRIGRFPQGSGLAHDAGEFADVPDNTTILGAAKITGRTGSGWSVGLLDAMTAREQATVIGGDAERFKKEVEPFTNYFVGQLGRDLNEGGLKLRVMATSVIRDLGDADLAEDLNRHAETVGLDGEWWINDRTYRLAVTTAFSQVVGDSNAILGVQRSSARYFHRPDRQNGSNGLFSDAYDSTLTSLRGYAIQARFSKESGDWLFEFNSQTKSPGFETNDLGFMPKADFVWMSANLVRRKTTPTKLFRDYWINLGGQQEYNYDGDLLSRQFQASVNATLHNYWWFGTFLIHRPGALSDRLTRGGPVVRYARSEYWQANMGTDSRKAFSLWANGNINWNAEGARGWGINANLTWRPASNLSLRAGPGFRHSETKAQYVTSVSDVTATRFFGNRYVFADLDQNTISMDMRVNWTFSPTLSLEVFAQPLISSGDYANFKEFDRPRALDKLVYGTDVGNISLAEDEYSVDPDGEGPAQTFSFGNPDFNFRSLRGNAVLRWEYLPGSTLFLVWTQSRSHSETVGRIQLGHDLDQLFEADADNIFLVKLNYWLGI